MLRRPIESVAQSRNEEHMSLLNKSVLLLVFIFPSAMVCSDEPVELNQDEGLVLGQFHGKDTYS